MATVDVIQTPQGSSVTQRGAVIEKRWLSVEEAAAYLGISRDTVYKWIERNAMPVYKVGRRWKFQAVEIDAWVCEGKAASSKTNQQTTAEAA